MNKAEMWLTLFKIVGAYGILWPLALALVARNGQRYLPTQKPLPDLMHWLLPFSSTGILHTCGEVLPFAVANGWLLFGVCTQPSWLFPYIDYMLSLQTLRCFMFNVTILPDASQVAHKKPRWLRYITGGLYDLMFSGHIMYLYAPMWFTYQQRLITSSTFACGVVSVLFCMWHILSNRSHYTVDLLTAVACSHWMYDYHRTD